MKEFIALALVLVVLPSMMMVMTGCDNSEEANVESEVASYDYVSEPSEEPTSEYEPQSAEASEEPVVALSAEPIVPSPEPAPPSAPAPAPSVAPAPSATPAPAAGGITRQSYEQIRNGMSIQQVQDIIGVRHSTESTSTVANITTVMRTWTTSNFRRSISVFFTNGYVTQTIWTEI